MTDADRDAKLRERARECVDALPADCQWNYVEVASALILAALRQTAEEARAEGERAGREAELFAQIAAAIRARGQRENP